MAGGVFRQRRCRLYRPVGGGASARYYDAIERGALKTRIADAQVVTAKKVVSFPQKRRRPVR
jgi:hypothetical protein